MKPCQINNKKAVIDSIDTTEVKQYFMDNDAELTLDVRTNGVTLNSKPINNSTIDNAAKLLTALKDKITELYGDIVETITVAADKVYTNIRFNDKTFNTLVASDTQETVEEAVETDEAPLDQQIENVFFNLNNKDVLRRKSNPRLNRLLRRTVEQMGVTVQKLEEYKKYWEARPENEGKELTQLGVADMVRSILAYSHDDGVTLPEEAFHFIVFANWNTPEIQAIVNTPGFEQTDVYQNNRDPYYNAYGKTITDEAILKQKVDMEIVGKMLAEYAYDKNSNNDGNLLTILKNLIKRFLSVFSSKIVNNSKLDRNNFNQDLRDALDIVVDDITTNAASSKFAVKLSGTSEVLIKDDSYFKNVLQKTISDIDIKIKELNERMVGLVDTQYDTYKAYAKKYNIATPDQIQANIDKLNAKVAKGLTLSATDQLLLKELNDFLVYSRANKAGLENNNRLERMILRKEQLIDNYKAARYEAGVYLFVMGESGNGGVLREFEDLKKFKEKVDNGTDVLSVEKYGVMVQTFEIYKPIIKLLYDTYSSRNLLKELDTNPLINKDMNDKLKKAINSLNGSALSIDTFLQINAPKAANDLSTHYQAINPDIDVNRKIFKDATTWNVWFGSLKAVKDEWGKIFHMEVNNAYNSILEKVHNFGTNLVNELKDDLAKTDLKTLKETFNGKPAQYFLSEVNTSQWVENELTAQKNAIAAAEAHALTTYGRVYKLPEDKQSFDDFFIGAKLSSLDKSLQSKEMTRREEMLKIYNKSMAIWYTANTNVRDNYLDIIEEKRKAMPRQAFVNWYSQQVIPVEVDLNGTVEYRYRGELIMPSRGGEKIENYLDKFGNTKTNKIALEDYSNPEYNRLQAQNPAAFRVLTRLREINRQDKAKLKLPKTTWEKELRLPQVSKNSLDAVYTKGITKKFSLLFEEAKESVLTRIDDNYHGEVIDGNLIKKVPIRYMSKLQPDLITDDLIRSTVMFHDMSTRYIDFNKILPKLNGMLDVVKYGKIEKRNYLGKEEVVQSTTGKTESNLAEAMENFLNANVYGEQGASGGKFLIGDNEVDINKASTKLMSVIRNTNLLGNVPSMLTGFFTSKITSVEEALLGRYYTFADKIKSEKEVALNMLEIIADFESPIKRNKFTIIASSLGVIDSPLDTFTHLDKSRGVRVMAQIFDYGGHRMFDTQMKFEGLANVSRGIKFINGEWYTKYKFNKSGLTTDLWDTAETLWDMLDTKDNTILYDPRITQDVIKLWKSRVSEVNHRLDTQTTDLDKARAHRNFVIRWTTMHMGWFHQLVDRGTKAKGFSYDTHMMEEGSWRTLWRVGKATNLVGILSDWDTLEDFEKENLQRLVTQSLVIAAMSGLAYIWQAIALGDDDEDDPVFKYMVYVTTRTFMELSARTSVGDLWEYILRPTASLENVGNITAPLDLLTSFFIESDEITKGFYDGYTQAEKNMIKSTPLVRGLFESLYGGYINEMTGKGAASVAVNIKAKNQFLVNKINGNSWASYLPLSFIFKLLGYAVARPVAGTLSPYPKAKTPLDLPTKKANK